MMRRGWPAPAVLLTLLSLSATAMAETAASRGEQVFLDRDLGHCVLCHRVATLDAPFQGNIGPDLSNVAARLSAAEIRDKVMDPTISKPDTTMPAYFRSHDLRQVDPAFRGKTILDAAQLQDLLAYLDTLRAAP